MAVLRGLRAHLAQSVVTDTFEHIVHVYGGPVEGPATRFDHELQAGEMIEWDGRQMRVVAARSEDRDYGPVRIVHLEPVSGH